MAGWNSPSASPTARQSSKARAATTWLLRDVGGQGAHTLYSIPRMRAEFALGAGGREAVLHYLVAPLATRCVREYLVCYKNSSLSCTFPGPDDPFLLCDGDLAVSGAALLHRH